MSTFNLFQDEKPLTLAKKVAARPTVVTLFGYAGLLGIAVWVQGMVNLWDGYLTQGVVQIVIGSVYTLLSRSLLQMRNWARAALVWVNLAILGALVFVDAYLLVWIPWGLGAWGSPLILLKYLIRLFSEHTVLQIATFVAWHAYVYGFLGTFTLFEVKKAFWEKHHPEDPGKGAYRLCLDVRLAMAAVSISAIGAAVWAAPEASVAPIPVLKDPATDPLDCGLAFVQKGLISDTQRVSLLECLAETYARVGRVDQAVEISRAMRCPLARARTLAGIGEALIAINQVPTSALDQAVEAIEAADSLDAREDILGRIAGLYALSGHYDRAVTIAKDLQAPMSRVRAGAEIAKAYGRVGRADSALEWLQQALQASKGLSSYDLQDECLGVLSQAALDAGHTHWARDKACQAHSPQVKARILARVGLDLLRTGDTEAQGILAQSVALLDPNAPDCDASECLRDLSDQWVLAGQVDQASRLARQIRNPLARAWALNRVAAGWIAASQPVQAKAVLDEVIPCLEQAPQDRAGQMASLSILLAVIDNCEQLGQMQTAETILKDLIALANRMANPNHRAAAQAAIVARYAQKGQFQQAFDLAETIDVTPVRTDTLVRLLIVCENTAPADAASAKPIMKQVLNQAPSRLAVWLGTAR